MQLTAGEHQGLTTILLRHMELSARANQLVHDESSDDEASAEAVHAEICSGRALVSVLGLMISVAQTVPE